MNGDHGSPRIQLKRVLLRQEFTGSPDLRGLDLRDFALPDDQIWLHLPVFDGCMRCENFYLLNFACTKLG